MRTVPVPSDWRSQSAALACPPSWGRFLEAGCSRSYGPKSNSKTCCMAAERGEFGMTTDTIANGLLEVADQTGATLETVERVFNLIKEADEYGGMLRVVDGKMDLFIGGTTEERALLVKVDASGDAILELWEPIVQNCRLVWGFASDGGLRLQR